MSHIWTFKIRFKYISKWDIVCHEIATKTVKKSQDNKDNNFHICGNCIAYFK